MKSIVITGVSTGIGYESAKFLIQKGYRVFGSVRKAEDGDRVKKSLGNAFEPLHFDVRNQTEIREAASYVKDQLGEENLFGLINNAGVVVYGPLMHIDPDEFQMQLDVNLLGVLHVTQQFLPLLGAKTGSNDDRGRIINIGSVSGIIGSPFLGPYCASKHALEAFSDCLRRELMIYGIDVILLQAGNIKTEIWQKAKNQPNRYKHTDYGSLFELKDKLISSSEQKALAPEKITKCILNALTKRNPRPRYLITTNNIGFWIAANVIPDRLIDRIIKKNLAKAKKFRPVI
jgi:short-subunit dehydrogenase